jgi:hypothetical protein
MELVCNNRIIIFLPLLVVVFVAALLFVLLNVYIDSIKHNILPFSAVKEVLFSLTLKNSSLKHLL